MITIPIASSASPLRRARRTLREQLGRNRNVTPAHIDALELVANELVGAALDAGVTEPLTLNVELFARLTSVRVRCPSNVEVRDEPFGVRERVLQGLAFAWGKRSHADGSVDLWAEVARPAREGPISASGLPTGASG